MYMPKTIQVGPFIKKL